MEQAKESAALLAESEIHEQWHSAYLNREVDRFYDAAFDLICEQNGYGDGDKILDAGCGYGYHLKRIADRCSAEIVGVDFSPTALASAGKMLAEVQNVTLQQGDLTALELDTTSFDHVVCWGVLMHVPEVEKALAELVRVLKPGGTLTICENSMLAPDVSIRERMLRALRHRDAVVTRKPLGLEVWTQNDHGGLLVRKIDVRAFAKAVEALGAKLERRVAGQFSEAYVSVPTRGLKRLTHAFNLFYFRHIKFAPLAAGNILMFRKRAE